MKTQEASKDFTKGEILFPNSKTSYIETNAQKSVFSTRWHTHAPIAQKEASDAH